MGTHWPWGQRSEVKVTRLPAWVCMSVRLRRLSGWESVVGGCSSRIVSVAWIELVVSLLKREFVHLYLPPTTRPYLSVTLYEFIARIEACFWTPRCLVCKHGSHVTNNHALLGDQKWVYYCHWPAAVTCRHQQTVQCRVESCRALSNEHRCWDETCDSDTWQVTTSHSH